eukprot:757067-Hanusia_phi.AAC.2
MGEGDKQKDSVMKTSEEASKSRIDRAETDGEKTVKDKERKHESLRWRKAEEGEAELWQTRCSARLGSDTCAEGLQEACREGERRRG